MVIVEVVGGNAHPNSLTLKTMRVERLDKKPKE